MRGRPVIGSVPNLHDRTRCADRTADRALDLTLPVRSPISALIATADVLDNGLVGLIAHDPVDVDSTMPSSEITATSVMPPPISTTRFAVGPNDVDARADGAAAGSSRPEKRALRPLHQ